MSCLPDLKVATPPDAAPDGPPTGPTSLPGFCGDGVIDFDGGEQCDPADGGLPGCTSKCTIACEDGGFVDDASNHCYFEMGSKAKVEDGTLACENAGGHLVTFVSDAEFARVFAWKASSFWVGLQLSGTANAYTPPPNVNEPGWALRCPGCFARYDPSIGAFPKLRDGGAAVCVAAGTIATDPWFAIACDLGVIPVPVVCEREPVGTTAHSCIGGTCLAVRFTSGTSRYQYFPGPVLAQEAADSCKKLGGTLVVFETREEREQIARELGAVLQKSVPTPEFWIGLSHTNAGWLWANGTPLQATPLEWGDRQPKPADDRVDAGAWISLSSAYDTQLAVAETDPTKTLPYLCELGAP